MKKILYFTSGLILLLTLFTNVYGKDFEKLNSNRLKRNTFNGNSYNTIISYDALFDCINQYTISTYYYTITNQEVPESILDDINCEPILEKLEDLDNRSEEIQLLEYQDNLKYYICSDIYNTNGRRKDEIPKTCHSLIDLYIKETSSLESSNKDLFNQIVSGNLACQISESGITENEKYVCNLIERYKLITDKIINLRRVKATSPIGLLGTGNDPFKRVEPIMAYEAGLITQVKVLQKLKTINTEAELQKFEQNVFNFNVFLQEFKKIINAFRYLFPNASQKCA